MVNVCNWVLFVVIVLCVAGNDVRNFLLTAHDLGFTNGDFVFMDVELFRFKGIIYLYKVRTA